MCEICHRDPCYGICPNADPFHGDQAEEEREYTFHAAYDDRRERYAESSDCDDWRGEEAALQAEDNARDVVRGDEETAPTAHVVVPADLHGECDDDIPF